MTYFVGLWPVPSPKFFRPWNAAGARAWVGDPALPPEQQGLVALGVPCGHPAYVAAQLQATRAKQDSLLQGIRSLPDLQSAWLLLLFCFVFPRDAVTFYRPCHLWLRSPLRKPMTRLSPPALRICWGPARSRALPSSLSSKVASSRAAPPAPPLRRRRCRHSQAALAAAGFDLPMGCRDPRRPSPPSPMSQATTCPNPKAPAAAAVRISRQSSCALAGPSVCPD